MQEVTQGGLSMTSLEEENFKIQSLFVEATELKAKVMTEATELNHTEEYLQTISKLKRITEKS